MQHSSVILLILCLVSSDPIEAMQRYPGGRPGAPYPGNPAQTAMSMISPAVCAGITGLLVGTGIGIGVGALIFNRPWNRGNIGGGLWFGRRRRRSLSPEDE